MPIDPNAPITEERSKKLLAGLLAIFLGSFGVHKFVLGYTQEGVILLVAYLVCFVGGFISCGLTWIALPILPIFGLIEGIMYLTKSDDEFVMTYVRGRKPWF